MSLLPVRFVVVMAIVTLVVGCASESTRTSTDRFDLTQSSAAHSATYGIVDTFTFGAPQEIRPANDFEFYFKECELGSPDASKAFFSKTAYSCTDGPLD